MSEIVSLADTVREIIREGMSDLRPFSYTQRDVRVVFGDGALARLDEILDETLAATRILLLSTPGRDGAVRRVSERLGDRAVASFDRARLHVPTTVVGEAMVLLREAQPDALLAIGGGSAIGLGKALVRETGLPLIAVPTTYAGSEMTDIWGVTDGDRKITGRDARVAPKVVVYDPLLTHAMPAEVTGPSGMNAIAHAVEALYAPDASLISSMLAEEGLRRLAGNLVTLVAHPAHGSARADALYGAHLCGRALDLTSMGLHHKLCHALGGALGLPHAVTHAVVLPYVVRYNTGAAPRAMATVAMRLGAPDAALGLWHLNRRLGITQTLQDLGVHEADVGPVIEQVTSRPFPNPAPVTPDAVRRMLRAAMRGDPPRTSSP